MTNLCLQCNDTIKNKFKYCKFCYEKFKMKQKILDIEFKLYCLDSQDPYFALKQTNQTKKYNIVLDFGNI